MSDRLQAQAIVEKMYASDGFSAWLGIQVQTIAIGSCICKMRVRKEMLNGFGVAHGGIAFALADSALAFAANGHGRVAVGLDNSISYPAPIRQDDELTAKAEELSLTNRTGFYRVTVINQRQEIVALFHGTVYRTEKKHFGEAQ
ncbi:MAG: hotdog fold thioesterase [Oligoflexia bacterium]|nr:hotdog fold thioesterase [Oligoflexia bacterium]